MLKKYLFSLQSEKVWTAVFLSIWVLSSHAQIDSDEASYIEETLVTGSRINLDIDSQTSPVIVISREDIVNSGKPDLVSFLQTQPGLHINRQGGPGGVTDIYLHGAESNFTTVMVNGIALNDPTNTRGGSVDLNNIDINSVERIEILFGPQSAIYGSDSLGGVVNIISRAGLNSQESGSQNDVPHRLQASLGNGGQRQSSYNFVADIGASGASGVIGLNLFSSEVDGLVAAVSNKVEGVNGRLEYQWENKINLASSFYYNQAEQQSYPQESGEPERGASDALDYRESDDKAANLQLRIPLSTNWHMVGGLSHFAHTEIQDSPGIVPFNQVPPNDSDSEFERDDLSILARYVEEKGLSLAVGADMRREEGSATGNVDFGVLIPTDFQLKREINGQFIEASFQTQAMTLAASLRRDDTDETDAETTGKLGVAYMLTPELYVKANWGEGFKLPSFFALGHSLTGNPDLLPEYSKGADISLRYMSLQKDINLELTLFDNEYRNLVDFDSETFRNVNRGQVESSGADLHLGWDTSENVTLDAFASYLSITEVGSDQPLRGRPDWKYGLSGNWQYSTNGYARLAATYIGESYQYTLSEGAVELGSYATLDLAIRHQVSSTLTLTLGLNNIFDKTYYQAVGLPSPAINGLLSAIVKF